MTPQVWIAIVIGIAATVEDLVRRQISNWICGAALAAGLALQIASGGWRGAASALLGALAGFGVFLVFYLLGGMGGGDVKLMAGFGSILGVHRLLEAALWTAACGGVFAALAIGFTALRSIVRSWSARDGHRASSAAKPLRSIPYAPAIAAGVWLSLVPKT
ncbi:MAG: prepilin peptidase [Bryobacteraceae bacterium]|jgi:prepilin peptidase CpaA